MASPVMNGEFSIVNFANKGSQSVLKGNFDSSGNLTFQTPASLFDADSTIVLNIIGGSFTKAPSRFELLFELVNDTIITPVICRVVISR